jgi:hypothetical protein
MRRTSLSFALGDTSDDLLDEQKVFRLAEAEIFHRNVVFLE